MTRNVLLITLLFFGLQLSAQEYNFGIRAGLNSSKFLGPVEEGEGFVEDFGFSTGFHFGITWDYNFTDIVSLKTEFLYIQKGTNITYEGDAYYKIDLPEDAGTLIERGQANMNLEISNAYISIPVMISTKIGKKWEAFGGVYGNILVQPTGRGIYGFESYDRPLEIVFDQSLDFSYRGDQAGGGRTLSRPIGILVDGEKVFLPKIAGAYYQHEPSERPASLINGLDAGLSFGFNYFMNRGFYFSTRANYGFLDVTDDRVDRSLNQINDDGSLVLRSDKDKHFGLQFSFGFRF